MSKPKISVEAGIPAAPSDVIGDHVGMLKGLVGMMGSLVCDDSLPVESDDLSWTLLLMSELLEHLHNDLHVLDEHYVRKENVEPEPTPDPKASNKKNEKLVAA